MVIQKKIKKGSSGIWITDLERIHIQLSRMRVIIAWFVTLNQYPDLTVYYTVSRDPLSMTSPSITTNFDEVSVSMQLKNTKKRMHLVMMILFLMIPLISYITQKLNLLKN